MKKDKKKDKYYLPKTDPPQNVYNPEMNLSDIEQKKYYYKSFPNLNHKLFIKVNRPKPPYQSRFEIAIDEVKK